MSRAAWFGRVSFGCALALYGCGSASDSGAPGGSAGSSAAGSAGTTNASGGASGAPASAGGSAGAATAGSANGGTGGLGDSKTEACIAYAIAACTRREECEGYGITAGCVFAGTTCPDAVFSDGSTRTAQGLLACAEAYKTFPCAKALKYEVPDCVTPGTRQADEPCLYPSQCASLECKSGSGGGCGVCAKIAQRGEACDGADVACGNGLTCTDSVCVYNGSYVAALGDVCQTSVDCPGLACSTTSHTCVALPTLGMDCTEPKHCGGENYCNGSTLTCVARPPAGADCGYDAAYGNIQACAFDSICNPSETQQTVKCAKIPGAGELCLTNLDNGVPDPFCTGDAYCDMAAVGAKCVAAQPAGAPCSSSNNECASGLSCLCPDGSTTCQSNQTCVAYHFKGEPCGTPGAVCYPAFTCMSGTCQPNDLQGYFAHACTASN